MSIKDLIARTAARKAAGESQSYPHHAGKATRSAAPAVALPMLRAGCHHEGAIVEPCLTCSGDLRSVRDCDLHDRATRVYVSDKVQACDRCPQYAAPEREGDVRCGVAIGSYKWPALVELQVRLIRSTCGPVPILVSNDDPASRDALAAVCAAHPDVTLVSSPERLGHTGGDLAVYHRAVNWGIERGFTVVAKVSQRLLFTNPYWLQDGARDIIASGLALATRACSEAPRYPLRTEFALLDVGRWNVPEVLDMIRPRRVWHEREGGWPAEQVIAELVRDRFGGVYWPTALLPTVRAEKGSGFVWHHSHTRADYDALAARFGVTLPADFTTAGWESEHARGEYLFG